MKADFDNAVKCLQKLISIDSVEATPAEGAPFGQGNADALKFALECFKDFGFSTVNLDNYCGYAEIGEGEMFGILSHLDVVPVDGIWDFPPFGGTIDGGRLYGRGALDDKGPTVAAMFACARLLEEGYKPKKRIRFILGCDEESGWKCMDYYRVHAEMPSIGISPDADFPVINCEKGVLNLKVTANKPEGLTYISAATRVNIVPDNAVAVCSYDKMTASLATSNGINVSVDGEEMTLTANGKAAHGSQPQLGDNALTKLLGALGIRSAACNKLFYVFNDYTGAGAELALNDEVSGSLTMNLGTAEVVGNDIVLGVDIRYPITFKKEDITAILQKVLSWAKVEETFFHLPLYVAKDDPLVVELLKAYNSVTGENAEPITIGGGTYARVLPKGVAFGPVFPNKETKLHQPNEYVVLSDFQKTIEIYYEAIKNICFDLK